MPPKNKFTKDEIIKAAINVTRKKGFLMVTARSVAEELHVSTQPLFVYFHSMEEMRQEIKTKAEEIYCNYVEQGLKEKIPFLGFGMQYIHFAKNEPELYRLLFLGQGESNMCLAAMERSENLAKSSIMQTYHMDAPSADRYFRDMWLVVHSIATLIVTESRSFTDSEMEQILTGFSVSLCKAIKEIPQFVAGDFDKDTIFKNLVKE